MGFSLGGSQARKHIFMRTQKLCKYYHLYASRGCSVNIHGMELAIPTSAKYPSITIHKEAWWDRHIGAVAAKANRTVIRIPRTLRWQVTAKHTCTLRMWLCVK